MNLSGKTVVITGGSSGLGYATAEHVVSQGGNAVLLDINADSLTQASTSLGVMGVPTDVSCGASVEQALIEVTKHHEQVHAVVNCAGVAPAARMVGREGPMALADFERVIQVNLIGTFNVCRVFTAHMTQQLPYSDSGERGVIINTASVAAYDGQIGQAAYSASKGGVVSMTLPLAREMAKFGVRVMAIAPGVMETPMMAGMPTAVTDALAATVPFPARLGDPHEYAQLVTHILENHYLNGTVIRLDGCLRMAAK